MVENGKYQRVIDRNKSMYWIVDHFSSQKFHRLNVLTKVRNVNNSCVLFKWLLIQKTIFVAQLNEGKPYLKLPNFMKITQGTLDKLEDILGESEYVVRYERGNFQSGWCLLEFKKIVVLNKFLNLEARINTLLELIPQLTIDFDKLTLDSQKLYEEVKRLSLTEA